MYICICNAIKESELRAAALAGPGDAETLYSTLGRLPQCGQCLEDAEKLIVDARAAAQVPACTPT